MTVACEKKDGPSEPNKFDNVVIESQQLGVWRLLVASNKRMGLYRYYEEFQTSIPYMIRLFSDVHATAPRLFVLFVLFRIWGGFEEALFMHMTTRILRTIEFGLTRNQPFVREVLWAIGLRVFCSALIAYMGWVSDKLLKRLRSQITSHFDLYLMQARLRMDIPASLNAENKIEMSGDDAWSAFEDILEYCTSVIELLSQIFVIYSQARITGGLGFVLVCLMSPLYYELTSQRLWRKVCYAYVNNDAYLRIEALKSLASGKFREDILSNDLGAWVMEQYKVAREKLGDTSDEHPFTQFGEGDGFNSPLKRIMGTVLSDLPMAYCGFNAAFSPSRFSLASIAIMQSLSSNLRLSLESLLYRGERFRKSLDSIKKVYSVSKIQNKVDGGQAHYPPSEKTASQGMSFELRNLSFSYPGSKKTTNALDSINLKIPGGSVVVLVGSNGSGKSTIVRILSRLFAPTSGDFLIDSRPADDYDLADLRRASTLLSQDNSIYPLSFAENIGLGCLDLAGDMDMIEKAAEQGGAAGFISKLDTAYNTVLDPGCGIVSMNLQGNADHPLQKEVDKLPKETKISGGETQRLVAARSFMRLNSGKVKFIAVDEPSSALDAEGELQLFDRLLEAREGKTMVFVTHRFGHLTKYADMIICMKDGKIEETGSHDELMKREGEYAKLYNIQANAFMEVGKRPETC
ncbi:hypothetical protein EST38_g399 [Candolleomyces aberdarensis]|uniref:ABC transporter domain-containing protein n=1 Tax=Candolleomyces aberdarensis TaxID=2316362 RepID=A0A4Q2E122_9AGAR|nr:hypothetical protein EST38_g399 [Candolleomyces aberdarensis]